MLNDSLMHTTYPGKLFIMSAPAGAGKTTLSTLVQTILPSLAKAPSYTTRAKRKDEKDGVDYHFVSLKEFEQLRQENSFLEEVFIHGNYYATSRKEVEELLSGGNHVLLVIDTRGAKAILKLMPSVLLFIKPPSFDDLRKRLLLRGTEPEDEIERRLSWAKEELLEEENFDFVVVNDDLQKAATIISSIIISMTHTKKDFKKNA